MDGGVSTLIKASNRDVIGTINFDPNDEILNYPVSVDSAFSCEDLINCQVGFDDVIPYITFPLFLGPGIPSMGQWALLILGLCITCIAVVRIRRNMLAG